MRRQSLQLETYEALRNAVALHLPIAWPILLLRSVAREHPTARPPGAPSTQLASCATFSRRPLSAHPSVYEAMLAIAHARRY